LDKNESSLKNKDISSHAPQVNLNNTEIYKPNNTNSDILDNPSNKNTINSDPNNSNSIFNNTSAVIPSNTQVKPSDIKSNKKPKEDNEENS
jgi:hypothetical protein